MADKREEIMLTTIDNPWNPFHNFDEWQACDHELGYDTLNYLARIANTNQDMPDNEYDQALDDAIYDILDMNLTGTYTFCTKDKIYPLILADGSSPKPQKP